MVFGFRGLGVWGFGLIGFPIVFKERFSDAAIRLYRVLMSFVSFIHRFTKRPSDLEGVL